MEMAAWVMIFHEHRATGRTQNASARTDDTTNNFSALLGTLFYLAGSVFPLLVYFCIAPPSGLYALSGSFGAVEAGAWVGQNAKAA